MKLNRKLVIVFVVLVAVVLFATAESCGDNESNPGEVGGYSIGKNVEEFQNLGFIPGGTAPKK